MEDAMVEAGLQQVETYVSCHQNTVAQYIATSPIMDLCMMVKRRLGPRGKMRWLGTGGSRLEGYSYGGLGRVMDTGGGRIRTVRKLRRTIHSVKRIM